MSETVTLRLDQIRIDAGTQMRTGLNEEAIAEYMEAEARGDTLPPSIVFYDGQEYFLADGFHRYETRRRRGAETIQVEVRPGTVRDARLFAAQANATHGLPRTDADKRRAVTALLEDDEWRRKSGREMARFLRVSEGLVRRVRDELGISAHDTQITVRRGDQEYEQKPRERQPPPPAPSDTACPATELEASALPEAPADDRAEAVQPAPKSAVLPEAKPPETATLDNHREELPPSERPQAYQIPLNQSAAVPILNSQLSGEGDVESMIMAAVADWDAPQLAGLVAKLGARVATPVPDRVPSDPEADWEVFRQARYCVPVPLRRPALADLLFDNDGDSMADEIRVAGRGWVGPCYRAELANGLLRTLPFEELDDDMMPLLAANLARAIARLPSGLQMEIGKNIAHRLEIQIDGRRKRKKTIAPQEVDAASQTEPSPGRDNGSGK